MVAAVRLAVMSRSVRAGLRLSPFTHLCAGRILIGVALCSFADGFILQSCRLDLDFSVWLADGQLL